MQYESMTIMELESAIENALRETRRFKDEANKLIDYLRETNRFKENARYTKEPFKTYLEAQFGIILLSDSPTL